MKQLRFLLFLILLICLNFINQGIFAQDSRTANSRTKLNEILEKAGHYCKKVKKMALFYICKEKITKKVHLYKTEYYKKKLPDSEAWIEKKRFKLRGVRKRTYIYDYQLIKKKGELKERRILLEEDGKKKNEERAELKMTKYVSKYLVYGPVGFLSKYWQDYFDYEIVGKDKVDDEKAIIIKSFPQSVLEENNNYGRIWVDENDFSILKIEWDPKSIKNYEERPIPSPIGDLKKEVVWSVSYGKEKNGVRFPSSQLIQEIVTDKEGDRFIQEETLFIYYDYKFFIVDVEVKY